MTTLNTRETGLTISSTKKVDRWPFQPPQISNITKFSFKNYSIWYQKLGFCVFHSLSYQLVQIQHELNENFATIRKCKLQISWNVNSPNEFDHTPYKSSTTPKLKFNIKNRKRFLEFLSAKISRFQPSCKVQEKVD